MTTTLTTSHLHVEIKYGRQVHYEAVADLAEASRLAQRFRDERHSTGANWRDLWVVDLAEGGMKHVAKISLNGRVWAPRPWQVGDVPLYDPRKEA